MERQIRFRSLYEGEWYYQTLEEMLTVTLAAFRNGKHKTQYTGLKDKNNKEIYEDDWCKAKFRTASKIWELEGRIIMDEFMWCIECKNTEEIYSLNRIHDVEIITSIYENPELLK